jgi:hypothetical protein
MPKGIIALQKKIQSGLKGINKSILILDPNVFISLVKEIDYYFQRKLISNEELVLLKQEILDMIDLFEKTAQTGIFGEGNKVHIYLSSLNINANVGYTHYNDITESFLWIFTANPLVIPEEKFSEVQKGWLDSMKRQSTLISQSNEISQMEFFYKQREYLDKNLIGK